MLIQQLLDLVLLLHVAGDYWIKKFVVELFYQCILLNLTNINCMLVTITDANSSWNFACL